MSDQKPSVGRIVHYMSHGTPIRPDGSQAFTSCCRAAIVSEVDPDDPQRVGLVVTNPTGLFFHALVDGGCRYEWHDGTAFPRGGTWHWPGRV